MTYWRMYQIRVLDHLREQETLLHIFERSSIRSVDIRDRREPFTNPGRCIDRYKGVPCPILVYRVTFIAVSVALSSK